MCGGRLQYLTGDLAGTGQARGLAPVSAAPHRTGPGLPLEPNPSTV